MKPVQTPQPSSDPHVPSSQGGSVARGGNRDALIIFAALAVFVAAVAVAVVVWGPVALAMAALILVPVVMLLIVVTTFG